MAASTLAREAAQGSRRCCLVKLISQCVRLLSRIGSGQNLDETPVPHSLLFSSVSKFSSSLPPAHLAAVTPITSVSVPISQRTHRQPRTHWDPTTSPCFIGSLFRRVEPIAWCWESGNSLHPLWATSTRILGQPHSTLPCPPSCCDRAHPFSSPSLPHSWFSIFATQRFRSGGVLRFAIVVIFANVSLHTLVFGPRFLPAPYSSSDDGNTKNEIDSRRTHFLRHRDCDDIPFGYRVFQSNCSCENRPTTSTILPPAPCFPAGTIAGVCSITV
jgi:hypothetical protein